MPLAESCAELQLRPRRPAHWAAALFLLTCAILSLNGRRPEETIVARPPPAPHSMSKAFAGVHWDWVASPSQQAPSQALAFVADGQAQQASTRGDGAAAPAKPAAPTVAAASAAAKGPARPPALPLISIYSRHIDRFVRVNSRRGLRADADYPWAAECWYRVLPQVCAQDGVAWSRRPPPPPLGSGSGGPQDEDEAAALARALGAGAWFALRSEEAGKLLLLHGADDERRAFVPLAELSIPKKRLRSAGPWLAPREACWRLESGGLRNRASGGWLNVRGGGELRGHSNKGPPWRVAYRPTPSTELLLRAVAPTLLRNAGLHANGTKIVRHGHGHGHGLGHSRGFIHGGGGGAGGDGGGAGGGGGNGDNGEAELPQRYSLLSVDYHIATAQDVGHTLRELGVRLEEQSLSGACGRRPGGHGRHTCADPKRLGAVLTRPNGFTLCPRPHALRRAIFEALRTAPLMADVDGVVCSHPAALCEAWLPFNKSLLVLVTTNLELARESPARWEAWLRTIVAMAAAPRVVLAANNRYDQEYVRHFTGVQPLYLPTLADYVTARWRGADDGRDGGGGGGGGGGKQARPFLMWRAHHEMGRTLLADLQRANADGARVEALDAAYPRGYEYADVARHPGVVLVPYTKSTMSFFELYRLGIPLFAPSLQLLLKWELAAAVMSERVYWRYAPSPLRSPTTPTPNSRTDRHALEHWLPLSDYYVYPHVQYFDSAPDLVEKLQSVDLVAVSAAMARHSREMRPAMHAKWRAVLDKLFGGEPTGSWPSGGGGGGGGGGFDDALRRRFGLELPAEEPDCERQSMPELGQWH